MFFLKVYIIMPQKTKRNKNNKQTKTRKQKIYLMRGCSKETKISKRGKTLGNKSCVYCGKNCNCGPKCNCSHPCPGTCYLNRHQKGGYGCGTCGCPIAPLSIKQMNQFGGKHGGGFFKQIGPMPGPIVGSNWGTSLTKWPGIDGYGGDRNFLKSYDADNNIVDNNPQLQMSMNDSGYKFLNSKVGGKQKKYNLKSKSLNGGGLVPQDLVNLGRDVAFNFESSYNALRGYDAPINPLPYKDQLSHSSNNRNFY